MKNSESCCPSPQPHTTGTLVTTAKKTLHNMVLVFHHMYTTYKCKNLWTYLKWIFKKLGHELNVYQWCKTAHDDNRNRMVTTALLLQEGQCCMYCMKRTQQICLHESIHILRRNVLKIPTLTPPCIADQHINRPPCDCFPDRTSYGCIVSNICYL